MFDPRDPRRNHLLSSLPAEECARITPLLELVPMLLGQVLYEAGIPLRQVYFPTTSIVSLLHVTADGDSAEIAVVGKEGFVGTSLFMGEETTSSRAVVRSAGQAYRLKGQLLMDEFQRAGPMQRVLLRYIQTLLTQMAQLVVCNRYHSLEQQFCRTLLMSLDRLTTNEIVMTHNLIANILGVSRENVTRVARKVKTAGLIAYGHAHIKVLDRPGLEARACPCYAAVKKAGVRALPEATTLQSPVRRKVLASIEATSLRRHTPAVLRYTFENPRE